MNIVQVFVALALFTISYVSAQQLVIESPVSGSTLVSGVDFDLTVTSGGTSIFYTATFTDSNAGSVVVTGLSTELPQTITTFDLVGVVTLVATTTESGYTDSIASTYNAIYSLNIAAIDDITYGEDVSLTVTTNVPSDIIEYTASFSCTSGSFQITGLSTGETYNLVPAGIYGQVVLTVTATNASPSTLSFVINRPDANIPPVYSPAQLPYYPSVYANMKDGKVIEIVNVKYSETAPLMN